MFLHSAFCRLFAASKEYLELVNALIKELTFGTGRLILLSSLGRFVFCNPNVSECQISFYGCFQLKFVYMKNKILSTLFGICALAMSAGADVVLNMADFGAKPDGSDSSLAVRRALEKCAKTDDKVTLVFPKGKYSFGGDMAFEKYCFISNNDEGLKRIVFLIENMKNLTVDGQGSDFVFYGFVNPFVVEDSSNITFKNFTVDVARPFHSEGIIESFEKDGFIVKIPENFPYRVREGVLEFTDGRPVNKVQTTVSKEVVYEYGGLLEFDTKKRETAYMARDYWTTGKLVAQDLGDRRVKIFNNRFKGTVGNTVVFACGHRNYPAFTLSGGENISIEGVTVWGCGGMGVLGQNVKNVYVKGCKFTPSEGRIVSCTADATHFVNCTGEIVLDGNVFENQMDDATNIHGIYEQISGKLDDKTLITRLVHGQQLGFKTFKPGDKLEFVRGKSMITFHTNTVENVEVLNKEFKRVSFKDPLPANEKLVGDAVAKLRDYPDIKISNNYIGKNRARGMLLNCRGKTVVENNVFHAPGAALLSEEDACFWFEQGEVRDCTIRNNTFDNCRFGVWGKGVIAVAAGIKEDFDKSRYNRNIKIYGNTFKVFDDCPLLDLYCVDGLKWYDNKIIKTTDYPAREFKNSKRFNISHSDNVDIKE